MKTQGEMIVTYIQLFGSITPMDAFRDLGITKLATRVSELIRRGYVFKKTLERSKNRFGKTVHYMRYELVEDNE